MPTIVASACGPGGFASDGGFGELGSGTDDASGVESNDDATTDDGPSTASATTADSGVETAETTDDGPDAGDADETSDSWIEPETETETGELPSDPPLCERIWTHLDPGQTHGHIGATPIGARPDGGFVSVNPVIGAGNDEVNVDAWFRSWSPEGALEWERLISWADLRDDPLTLVPDQLGDLFTGGRINANTQLEDAMVAGLDGLSGEVAWTFLRGEPGGYASLAHNGAALVAAGQIGLYGARRLELVAFEPDTGAVLWSAEPELGFIDLTVHGLVMADGLIDVLVAGRTVDTDELQVLRFAPPDTEPTLLASLSAGSALAAWDLERFGSDRLVALHRTGGLWFLVVLARDDGEILTSVLLHELGLASGVEFTALAETPEGLAVAGTLWDVASDRKTFILRLDEQLEPICVGMMGKNDVVGLNHSPELRRLVVGLDGELITGSYATTQRVSVFARWD